MDRPTIFLSSTVHDFADLRSALKDYLELRGCRVLASEFTDFTRPLDKHSYQACLDTIEQADLFVLFIGRRVGGWFDEPNKISITRAEYRHAYKLAQEGRIRLMAFVRSDVWNHRQSAGDLAKALAADKALTDEQRRKLANHPTLAMENAEATISFLDEVTKNVQTALAAKGRGTAPVANWICPFGTFAEVRQALDPLITHGLTVRDASGRKALEVQLHSLLQQCVPIINKKGFNPVNSILNLRNKIELSVNNFLSEITLDSETWTRLVSLVTHSPKMDVDFSSLLGTLNSDLLLRYEPTQGTFQQTEEYDLLAKVVEQARLLQKSGSPNLGELLKHGKAINATGDRRVPGHLIVEALHRLLRWVDLVGSARALARSLAGGPLEQPAQIPWTPLVDQEEGVRNEAISMEQVRQFVDEWAAD